MTVFQNAVSNFVHAVDSTTVRDTILTRTAKETLLVPSNSSSPVLANSSNPYQCKGNVGYSNVFRGESEEINTISSISKAPKKFDALPAHVKQQLPAVAETSLYALLDENEYINLTSYCLKTARRPPSHKTKPLYRVLLPENQKSNRREKGMLVTAL